MSVSALGASAISPYYRNNNLFSGPGSAVGVPQKSTKSIVYMLTGQTLPIQAGRNASQVSGSINRTTLLANTLSPGVNRQTRLYHTLADGNSGKSYGSVVDFFA